MGFAVIPYVSPDNPKGEIRLHASQLGFQAGRALRCDCFSVRLHLSLVNHSAGVESRGLFRCPDHAAASDDPIGRVFDLFRCIGFPASSALPKPASNDVEGVIAAVRQAATGGCGFGLGGFWVVLHGVSLSTMPTMLPQSPRFKL